MKRHDHKPYQKEVTPNQKEVCEKIEYHSTVDMVALENKLVNNSNKYKRKLELEEEVKQTNDIKPVVELELEGEVKQTNDDKSVVWRPWEEGSETLKLFRKHEQDNDDKPVEWRAWQKELLGYLDNPSDRRIIWVVGGEGNEGKTYFITKIRGQYGWQRVCAMPLRETKKDLFRYMEKVVDPFITDIFLFNVSEGGGRRMKRINYRILENIKDGGSMTVVGNGVKRVRFTTPNVVMVFSNEYPDTRKLSSVRWMIFKINSEMQLEDVTEAQLKKERDEV